MSAFLVRIRKEKLKIGDFPSNFKPLYINRLRRACWIMLGLFAQKQMARTVQKRDFLIRSSSRSRSLLNRSLGNKGFDEVSNRIDLVARSFISLGI